MQSARKFPPVYPEDPAGAEFCLWFWSANQGWDWIRGCTPTPEGEKTRWTTESYPIQPDELWFLHQESGEAIGVGFQAYTRYCLIDIDRGSLYHPMNNQDSYARLLETLRSIGLVAPVAVRSSWSEGIHLYYPLPKKKVNSFGLACAVKWTLFDSRIFLQGGQVESFPNVKSYGKTSFVEYKAHRLPLQPGSGSALLDGMLEPYSESVADLLDEFQQAAKQQHLELLENAIANSWERQRLSRGFGSSDRAERWRKILEQRITRGWTAFSQTNSLLKDFATYGRVFLALEGQILIEYVAEQATNAPGYTTFCRHQHEIRRRVADWCISVERYYWPLRTPPTREGTYRENFGDRLNNIVAFASNSTRSAQAEERIRQAVTVLEERGELPATATARSQAVILAAKELTGVGVSQTTLHKPRFLPLWHPAHRSESCVMTLGEAVSDISDDAGEVEVSLDEIKAESPESPCSNDESENYTQEAYMKGLGVALPLVADEPPQVLGLETYPTISNHSGVTTETLLNLSQEETIKKSNDCVTSGTAQNVDKSGLSIAATQVSGQSERMRIMTIRVGIGAQLRQRVEELPCPRSRQEVDARNQEIETLKYQLYLESGEPMLVREAMAFFPRHNSPTATAASGSHSLPTQAGQNSEDANEDEPLTGECHTTSTLYPHCASDLPQLGDHFQPAAQSDGARHAEAQQAEIPPFPGVGDVVLRVANGKQQRCRIVSTRRGEAQTDNGWNISQYAWRRGLFVPAEPRLTPS